MFFADYSNFSNDSAVNQSETLPTTVSIETVARDDYDASSTELSTLDRYVTPIWYIIGVPGNVIAYVVWIQRRMRHSSGCYLAALAFDEGIFLLLQVGYRGCSRCTIIKNIVWALLDGYSTRLSVN